MTSRGIICLESLQKDIQVSLRKIPDYIDFIPILIFFLSFGCLLYRRIFLSKFNQWLVIVQNGVQKKSGKGICSFLYPQQTYIKINDDVWNIPFRLQLITQQWQGVLIQGHTFFGINPENGGPYCFHKFISKQNRQIVGKLSESAVRTVLSSLSLQEVLTNRQKMKQLLKNKLEGEMKGWGVIVKNIKIREIKVLSPLLQDKLQAQFKIYQNYDLKKRQIRSYEQSQKRKERLKWELFEEKRKQSFQEKKIQNDENMERLQKQTELIERKQLLKKQIIDKEKELQIIRINAREQVENAKRNNKREIQNKKGQSK